MLFETHKVIYSGKDAENLIGKEFYYSNDLLELCLDVEKENPYSRAILVKADNDMLPFKMRDVGGHEVWVKLLYPIPEENIIHIVKDEEEKEVIDEQPSEVANEQPSEVIDEPHYRAFNSVDELIERWNFLNPCTRPAYTMPLIWVKYKDSNTIQLVTAFADNGVEMGAEFMTWEYFFEKMEFLDETPCGVLIE